MRRLIFALLMVAAACGSPAVDISESTTSTTTNSVSPAPTTTTADVPAVRPFETGRFTVFEPGTAYESDDLVVEVRLAFQLEGWISDVTAPTLLGLYTAPDGDVIRAAANIGVAPEGSTVSLLADGILAGRHIADSSRELVTVAGREATRLDLVVQEPPPENPARTRPCDDRLDLFLEELEEGGEQSQWDRGQLGTGAACADNRIWLIDVDGWVVVLHISALTPQPGSYVELNGLGPYPDDFIKAITFCTAATPCDD